MSDSLPCSSESSLQGINTGEATSSTSRHLDIPTEPTDNTLEEKPCPITFIFPEIEGKHKVLEKIGEGKGNYNFADLKGPSAGCIKGRR